MLPSLIHAFLFPSIMTIRSPNPNQTLKSSTCSRRLRNRADQGLCIQPPQLPHSRPQRSHRASLLSSTRPISVSYPSENPQTVWDPSSDVDSFTRSNISAPSGFIHNQPSELLPGLTNTLTFPPQQQSPNRISQSTSQLIPGHYATAESDLLPSPLPSLSGSYSAVDFDLDLSPEPENHPHIPTELQEMRYGKIY